MPGWFSRAKARDEVGGGPVRLIVDAQLGIGEGADVARLAVGADAVAGIGVERGAQVGDGAVVNRLQLVEDGGNVVDAASFRSFLEG